MSISKYKKDIKFFKSYDEKIPSVKDEIKRIKRRYTKHRKKGVK